MVYTSLEPDFMRFNIKSSVLSLIENNGWELFWKTFKEILFNSFATWEASIVKHYLLKVIYL